MTQSKEQRAEQARKRNAVIREETINAYGGKCACCGEDEMAFLVLDHINDNGREHRASLGAKTPYQLCGIHTYRALRRDGYPSGIVQVLCANCNMAKTRGQCPHQMACDADHTVEEPEVLAGNASDVI